MSKKKKKNSALGGVFSGQQKSKAKIAASASQQQERQTAIGVLIQPNDPVFFRDGKPFTMGEEVHTTGIFPPLPSVLQGALRSVYFAQHPDEIPVKKEAGQAEQVDNTAKAAFANVLLCQGRELLFPWPADLLLVKEAILPLKPTRREKSKFLSSQGNEFPYFLEPKTPNAAKVESSAHSYLTRAGMVKYLSGGEIQPSHHLNLKDAGLLHEESRIGIGRNAHGVTEEGQLYRMTRLRMQDDLRFYVAHDGLDIPGEGTLALGSEGVSAHYASTNHPLGLPGCTMSFSPRNIYKLYVMSPAVVETVQPYLPPYLQAKGVQVLTFASGRPIAVGGWDMKANEPKPMRNAIPAGAVYYFTVANAPTYEKIKAIHGQSDYAVENWRQGFGIVLLGIYQA